VWTTAPLASIVKWTALMRAPPRPETLALGPASSAVAILTAACFALATSGCLSNEYRIKQDELRRLAELPPTARGQGVRVSQTLGERRCDAIDPSFPEPATEIAQPDVDVELDLNGSFGEGGSGSARGVHEPPARGFAGDSARGWRATPPSASAQATSSGGGFHGTPSGGGAHVAPSGGFHGTPSGGLHGGGGGYHLAAHGGGGGGSFNFSGGGGGKDAAAVLVIVMVVAVVAATVATVSLAASEGVRFEGHAEMAPEQLVYLKDRTGAQHAVPLLELTRADAAAAESALVMDDEGYGLRRLDHAPLDRKGGVFRFDLGAGAFTWGDAHASGVSAHIQGGAFFTHTFGLVLDLGLGGGSIDPCCAGALAPGGTLTRHSLGLEAQAIPVALGPLHLGAFAGGGLAIAGSGGAYEDGPMASAGALLELDLTSHMAFAVRGGASRAWLPSGTSSAGTLTGGLAIY
jgi:hypothetical protein